MLNKLKSSFWLNSIFYTLMQRGSLFVFGAIAYMILVRAFTKEDNSTWALYLTILTLFETIKQGLLRNPTIKFLGLQQYSQQTKAVQSAALSLNIVCSLLAILLFTIGASLIGNFLQSADIIPMLYYSVLFILILIPYNHFEILLQAKFQFSKIFWAYFARQGIFFGGIAIIYFIFPPLFTLINLVYLQIISLFTGMVILGVQAQPFLAKGFEWQGKLIKEMFHFGKYIFGTNLFSNLSRNFDHFITANTLTADLSKNWVANYNMVSRINNMVDVPSLAAADVLFPKNVEAIEEKGLGQVKYYFEKMVGTILAVIVPISLFIFLFPKFVIYILADTEYFSAIPILQITIMFGLVRPISYQYGSTLDAIGKPQVNFYTNLLFMIINLALTYFGLKYFGPMGAAYATVANYTIIYILMMIILNKYIDIESKNLIKYMFDTYKTVWNMFYSKFRKRSAS